jgi:hypothetical protein
MMGTKGRTILVGAGCTLAMLRCVAETWNDQGNDCFDWVLEISTTSGSDVTCYSNENPIITSFFPIAYLE